MSRSVQNSEHLVNDVNYFGDFSFLLGELMANNRCSLGITPQCTQAKGNRRIQISFKLREYRQQAKENLLSAQGIALRKQRGLDVEGTFGDIKHNMGVRRFLLRGLKKVETEWGILSIAHNMRKLAAE